MNASTESTEQERIAVIVGIIVAVAEAIRELGSVPSGHIYARLMGRMSLETYEGIINVLVRKGIVRRESSHLLVWTGNESQSNPVPDVPGCPQLNADR